MIEITIRPHAHIVDMLADPGDDASDTWLGRHLPWSAAARLARYQELATARILEAIEGAEVEWTSDQIRDSGGVEEVEITPPEDDDEIIDAVDEVRQRVEQILGQTLQEVCQWEPEVRCQCGEVVGEMCSWTGPRAETVVVEWMPEYLRGSHTAAGNRGVYPENGAIRIRVARKCAEVLLKTDADWAFEVKDPTV